MLAWYPFLVSGQMLHGSVEEHGVQGAVGEYNPEYEQALKAMKEKSSESQPPATTSILKASVATPRIWQRPLPSALLAPKVSGYDFGLRKNGGEYCVYYYQHVRYQTRSPCIEKPKASAWKAGLRPGDQLVAVDGIDFKNYVSSHDDAQVQELLNNGFFRNQTLTLMRAHPKPHQVQIRVRWDQKWITLEPSAFNRRYEGP